MDTWTRVRAPARRTARAVRQVLAWIASLTVAVGTAAMEASPTVTRSVCTGGVVNVVAHPDDDLLFLSPDLLHDVQARRCSVTVYLTAGDAGRGPSRWLHRERGARAAYAQMAGVDDTWSASEVTVAGTRLHLETLVEAPEISLIFLRLPDGAPSGSGYPRHGHQSLRRLWEGAISTVTAVDGSARHTSMSLTATLAALLARYQPAVIRTLDHSASFGSGDHADHLASARFAGAASQAYRSPHTLVAYAAYPAVEQPPNVSGADLAAKRAAFAAYARHDDALGRAWPLHGRWRARLTREYIVASSRGE